MMKCDQRGKSISLYDNILEFNKVYSMKAQISRRTAMVALTKIRSDKYFFSHSLFYARFVSLYPLPTHTSRHSPFISIFTNNEFLFNVQVMSITFTLCVRLSFSHSLCVYIPIQTMSNNTVQYIFYNQQSPITIILAILSTLPCTPAVFRCPSSYAFKCMYFPVHLIHVYFDLFLFDEFEMDSVSNTMKMSNVT